MNATLSAAKIVEYAKQFAGTSDLGDALYEPALSSLLSAFERECRLEENRQHKAGRHDYSLEKFGYRKEEVLERFQWYHDACLPGEITLG